MRTPLTESTNESPVVNTHRKTNRSSANKPTEPETTSTLIEFPGSRNVPEWRKQLSQKVREIQEQKAREAAEEKAAHRAAEAVSCALPSGQLELVPEPEAAPLNPIVSKALERVDRARRAENLSTGFPATAAAPALAASPSPAEASKSKVEVADAKPKLTIVTAPLVTARPGGASVAKSKVSPVEEEAAAKPKRVRVISESVEAAALSYLETCLSVPVLSNDTRRDIAGLTRRAIVGVFDLILIALMVSPVVAAIQVNGGDWFDPRVIGLMAAVTLAVMLAYLTISIALTGRTLSMRLLSVRTIDARTGFIPTGSQSVKRALAYVFSLSLLGLGFALAFADREHRTLHDRFSRTIVVRD